jgi:hypothetical protein
MYILFYKQIKYSILNMEEKTGKDHNECARKRRAESAPADIQVMFSFVPNEQIYL